MWLYILGEINESPRKDVPVNINTLISEDYKIMLGDVGWTGPQYPNNTNPAGGSRAVEHCGDGGCLYNIKDDPEERMNLASSMPEMLATMRDKNWLFTRKDTLILIVAKHGLGLVKLL